jgi:hypothetical protein
MRYYKTRRGSSGSFLMPPPHFDHLPEPASVGPERNLHGRRGCAHPLHGVRHEPAFKNAAGHDREVFDLLNWGIEHAITASETQWGSMRLDLREPWRTRLIDSLDRMAALHPSCIGRTEGATWSGPCPRCGRGNYIVVIA